MQQRIVGIETEFGLSYVPKGLGRLSNEEAAAALFKPVLDEWRSTNVFLPNGGRLYLDVGSHPEYASAECASIEELLAQERAGELLLARLARQAQQRLRTEGAHGTPLEGSFYLLKNNVDSAGNSYGSHENYLISRKLAFPTLIEQLVPLRVRFWWAPVKPIRKAGRCLVRLTRLQRPVCPRFRSLSGRTIFGRRPAPPPRGCVH